MDSAIQQIKDRLDIVEVVSGYLKLEKTGINLRARCPFHQEKGPSFFVSPSRQMFKCFGCSASGSVIDFVMKIEGIEFVDALRILATRAGVELTHQNPEQTSQKTRLYEICELSARFFEKQLELSQAGKLVLDYLKTRGLTDESIKKWRIGYAPDSWRSLVDFLISKGYKKEEVVMSGVAILPEKVQNPYDRFRNRIMFPIFDLNGQAIGFGGRVFDKIESKTKGQSEGGAKYVNISNTPLYDKSKTLYGMNFAKLAIRQKDSCILTEGYMDVILSQQAGALNTVAASGTALTEYQLQIIKRYTNNLLFAFDMDPAGGMATTRGINLAQHADFNVKVITMPKDEDPADVASKDPEKWNKLVLGAIDVMDFYFELAQLKFDKQTPQGKKEIANMLLPVIKSLSNAIVQSHWVQKLSGILKTSEENIISEMGKIQLQRTEEYRNSPNMQQDAAKPSQLEKKSRKEMLEERIMCLLCADPQNVSMVGTDKSNIFSQKAQEFLEIFWQKTFNTRKEVEDFLDSLKDKSNIPEIVLDFLAFSQEELIDENDKMAEVKKERRERELMEELGECLKHLRDLNKRGRFENLSQEIKAAEQEGNEEKLKELLESFNQQACFIKDVQN